MNEQYRLNSEMVREILAKEDRKATYLVKRLNVSQRTVDKMLSEEGHVPKPRTLEALAALLGVTEQQLLIPRAARTA